MWAYRDMKIQIPQYLGLTPIFGLDPVKSDRGDRIRTCDIQLPKLALYQAELHPGNGAKILAKKMVARDGIEPPTRGFSIRCSTN